MGDFNSQTGLLPDFLDFEPEICNNLEFLDDLETNISHKMESLGIPSSRNNLDKKVNTNGNLLIDLCQSLDLKIGNGRCGPDNGIRGLTFHGPQGSSLIDYCIVSTELLPRIKSFEIGQLDKCLIRCPLSYIYKTLS